MQLVKNSRRLDNPYRLACECQIDSLDDIYYERFGVLTNGFFVEVGAFDGYTWSNTYGLAQMGWTGILIEPQPDYAAKCRALYSGNNNIQVFECACGAYDGKTDLYLGGSLSTTKATTIDVYNSMEWSRIAGLDPSKRITVDMHTLDYILEEWVIQHGYDPLPGIDVMVVDVEGAELDVLRGFDAMRRLRRYCPRMFIIETHENYPDSRLSYKSRVIKRHMRRYGYEEIHADTVNSIFWREG